jgi:hypothetical protein
MASRDSETFRDLSPLLVKDVAQLPSQAVLNLGLLEVLSEVGAVLFRVTYTHRELVYRSPGQRDAVAFGSAALDDDGQVREVRILFSQVHDTATMRGLTLEGHVKPIGANPALIRAQRASAS